MAGDTGWDGISAQERFELDGVRFRTGYVPLDDGSFTIVKSQSMVERYRELLASFAEPRMVEIGIAFGGGVALLNLIAEPSRFLGLELNEQELTQLSGLIVDRGWGDRVRVEYGVDQADRELVLRHVLSTFGDEPLDMVFDDASHLYGPTKASFEVLFPLLRPGGVFVIEDWKCDHEVVWTLRSAVTDPTSPFHEKAKELAREHSAPPVDEVPLSRLALELVSARAETEGVIARVSVDDQWITVERGPAPLDPRTFRLADHAFDHYRQLSPLPA